MIQKIEYLRNAGFFQNFRWPSDTEKLELKRLSLIYGANGSGKSSLSNAFIQAKASHSSGTDFKLVDENGVDFTAWDRVFVFSETYIQENYHLNETDATTPAIVTVGERSVAEQKELEQLQRRLPDLSTHLYDAQQRQQEAQSRLDLVKKTVRDSVVNILGVVGRKYQTNTFNVRTVESIYRGDRQNLVLLDEDGIKQAAACLHETQLNKLSLTLPDLSHSFVNARSEAARLLTAQPIAVVLDTLAAHPSAAAWVQQGIDLHAGIDTCIFCGGPLTKERRDDISAHFSGEVQRVTNEITALIDQLEHLSSKLDQIKTTLPQQSEFSPTLKSDYEAAKVDLLRGIEAIKIWLTDLLGRLRVKLGQVVGYVDDLEIPPTPRIDIDVVTGLIKQHNQSVDNFEQIRDKAAEQLRNHYLASNQSDYDCAVQTLTKATLDITEAQQVLNEAQQRINDLSQPKGNILPSAEFLTIEVARLLGRNELTFVARDADRYEIQRYGSPAYGLSEGERTAITLVHFIETVHQWDGQGGGKPIVVVDDPVSSLDHGVYMGVSAALWSLLLEDDATKLDQMILLTHNFDLFRQWDVQYDYLPGPVKTSLPRMTGELSSYYKDGRRNPALVPWPPQSSNPDASRKKVRSSYHHAFFRLAQEYEVLRSPTVTFDDKLEAQLLFPNVMRRVLEAFLAFKYPGAGGTLNKLIAACKPTLETAKATGALGSYPGDTNALRYDLVRYTNGYSHEGSPEVDLAPSPEEVLPAIASLFMFMDAIDHDHYEGMCDAVGCHPLLDAAVFAPNGLDRSSLPPLP